jgi:hypothetical protein
MKILQAILLLSISLSVSADHAEVDNYATGSGFLTPDSESKYFWQYNCNTRDELTGVYFTSLESEIDTNRAYLLHDCALMVLIDETLDANGVKGLVDITLELTDPAPAVYFRQIPLVYCDGFGPPIDGCITAD